MQTQKNISTEWFNVRISGEEAGSDLTRPSQNCVQMLTVSRNVVASSAKSKRRKNT
jgi:hypothetical protein